MSSQSSGTDALPIPQDALRYVHDTFAVANRYVSSRLDRMPTLHEEALDFAFIDALSEAAGPHVVPSGVVVDFEVHFVGGGTHWERWEVADPGVIVNFRLAGRIIRTKIILLQSKRIYPRESEFTEDRGLARIGGFGSLMTRRLCLASSRGYSPSTRRAGTKPCRSATLSGGPSRRTNARLVFPFTIFCITRALCRIVRRSRSMCQ